MKMFITAENCMEKWIILSNRCIFLLLVIVGEPEIQKLEKSGRKVAEF